MSRASKANESCGEIADALESGQAFVLEMLFERHIPECVQLAVDNFDELRIHPTHIEQWFERRIVQNPWQKALPAMGLGIRREGRLIAFRAMLAQPWWINGQAAILAFGANTTVDSGYRGQGLARRLIADSTKFAAITGSTTAGVITQKAYRKLGYAEIGGAGNDFFGLRIGFQGSLVKRIGEPLGPWLARLFDLPLQRRDAALRPQPGFYLQETSHCDDEFDRLWEQAKHGYSACIERGSAYLNWRLFDAPTCQLRLGALRDGASTLRGFAVWHVRTFAGSVAMAVLRDIFYPRQDEAGLRTLLALLIRHWREQGISWASLEVASPEVTALFIKSGYRLQPSHGNRYQIHGALPLTAGTLENWFRSGLDGDYFDHPL